MADQRLFVPQKSLFTDGSGRLCRNVVSTVMRSARYCVWENNRLEHLSYIKIEETGQRGGDYGIHQSMHDRAQ